MKTTVRPSFWAFFNGRPSLPLPLADGLFIALQRSACRALWTPVQLPQQFPDMSGMVTHAELLVDQVRYPLAGPQRRLIAKLLRTLQQAGDQTLTLRLIQQWLATSPTCRLKRFLTFLRDRVGPPAHRLATYLHAPGHFALVESLPEQLQPFKPPLLQPGEIPFHTSRITHIEKTNLKGQ
jgi:hypothetical protein